MFEGPPSAGCGGHGGARGMLRESIAMSKAYAEARAQHGESELLDEIVAAKPEIDHTRYHSAAELWENGLKHLRDATALLEGKATAEELDEYRRFVLALAGKVAAAHKEEGQSREPSRGRGHRGNHSGARDCQLMIKPVSRTCRAPGWVRDA